MGVFPIQFYYIFNLELNRAKIQQSCNLIVFIIEIMDTGMSYKALYGAECQFDDNSSCDDDKVNCP